jgi:hypothetical protein
MSTTERPTVVAAMEVYERSQGTAIAPFCLPSDPARRVTVCVLAAVALLDEAMRVAGTPADLPDHHLRRLRTRCACSTRCSASRTASTISGMSTSRNRTTSATAGRKG